MSGDRRGREGRNALTRTKNRCTWSFRLHASRAHTSTFVIKRRICAREERYGISSPLRRKVCMHAGTCPVFSRGNIREGNIQDGLSLFLSFSLFRKIAGFYSRISLTARIFPRRENFIVTRSRKNYISSLQWRAYD